MPYLDGTGPFGTGPYGRGMGPCRGGRLYYGFGRGRRMGLGYGFRIVPDTNYADEKEMIRREIEALETRLKYLKERLKEEETGSP